MQIVQELGGYSLGRADLVRRAMSKKKAHVMEEERHNFVYGNKEEGVPGCIAKGIPEQTANHIYDTMIDFAKYAFNKSHAACYGYVTYQTAWLKYYYPSEFMAALLTSVIDNPDKCAGYISSAREMKIRILPPDINESSAGFAVVNGDIRFALTAIKGVGRPVIEAIEEEKKSGGPFRDLRDFIERIFTVTSLVNKRVIENFIKSGAFDCFHATRKQMMSVYSRLIDEVQESSKNNLAGQMSLFDFAPSDTKKQFEIQYPDVGEYDRDLMLSFEKEVLGVYVSGHPLDQYIGLWKANITRRAVDFIPENSAEDLSEVDTRQFGVTDDETATIGGIIKNQRIKYTKKNQVMAFLELEDLTGSVEVIVFPKAYEQYKEFLSEDHRVFIQGRVQIEEEGNAKLLASSITPFDNVPRRLWLRFASMDDYQQHRDAVSHLIDLHGGRDHVVLYLAKEHMRKMLPAGYGVSADEELLAKMQQLLGEQNVVLQ